MAARSVTVLVAFVVMLMVTPLVVNADLPVVDALANINAIMELAQMVKSFNLAVRDLAPLSEISEAIGVAADLQIILTESQTIASQMQSRRGLWGSSVELPTTSRAFAEMRRYHTELCHLTATQGLRAQSIIAQVPMLLNRATRLLQSASRILGSVAGLQAANAVIGEVSGHLSVLTTALTSANEPQLCEIWTKRVQEQAMEAITQHLTRDYGVLPEGR